MVRCPRPTPPAATSGASGGGCVTHARCCSSEDKMGVFGWIGLVVPDLFGCWVDRSVPRSGWRRWRWCGDGPKTIGVAVDS